MIHFIVIAKKECAQYELCYKHSYLLTVMKVLQLFI